MYLSCKSYVGTSLQKKSLSNHESLASVNDQGETQVESKSNHVKIPTDETDVWEIDVRMLKFEKKVASGSYGDL